jgi:hypothetical protein
MNDAIGVKVITSALICRLEMWFRRAMHWRTIGGGGSTGRSVGLWMVRMGYVVVKEAFEVMKGPMFGG